MIDTGHIIDDLDEHEEREFIWRHNARADCRRAVPTKGRIQQSLREVLSERDALAAGLAAVEALADEWDAGPARAISTDHAAFLLHAAVVADPADTTR